MQKTTRIQKQATIRGTITVSLSFFQWNTAQYFSKKLTYKERTSRTVAAATGGGEVADCDLEIEG